MVDRIDTKPDIKELIKYTKERQEALVPEHRNRKSAMTIDQIMMNIAYGAYRLGLEVGAGLKAPVDIDKVTMEELLPNLKK